MSILAEGKTPEEWAAVLAERSIPVSVRTLREAANRIGACHKLGRAMIITPDQMDMILQEGQQCRSNRISAAASSGFLTYAVLWLGAFGAAALAVRHG